MTTADEIRARQRTTWDGLSGAWDRWDAVIMEQMRPVGESMLDRLDLAPHGEHLDIASGTGEPGLTAARRVPGARVVLTDLSEGMLGVAERRAVIGGLANVETVVCSADDLPFADGRFDTVSVRFGYMFFPDMAAATAEFARVLRPGGRLCSSVWIEPLSNPWTTVAMDAVGAETPLPVPDPDAPSMYRCAAPGFVRRLFEQSGLVDVDDWDVRVEIVTATADEYWRMISEHVSLVSAALERVDRAAKDRIRAGVLAGVAPFERDGAIRVPGLARCTIGTKPDA